MSPVMVLFAPRRVVACVVFAVAFLPGLATGADGFGKQTVTKHERGTRLEYVLPEPQFVDRQAPDGRSFTEVKVKDAGHSSDIGRPDLPTLVDDIAVAARGEVSVRVLGLGSRQLVTPHWVYPAQASVPKLPGARERQRFVLDETWYQATGKAPRAAAEVPFTTQTYVVRGKRFVRLIAAPYAHDPASRTLAYPEAVTVEVAVADPSLPAAAGPRTGPVQVLRVPLASRDDLAVLQALGADVKTVREGEAIVYATEAERLAVVAAGLAAEVIEVQAPAAEGAGLKAISAGYHDWAQVQTLLTQFVASYPGLCRLETIGTSGGGRPMQALCISDNPGTEEAEPEVRFGGAIHGDEVVGTEMCLQFIDYVLSGYATDTRLRTLVDGTEIWVVPVMNPDGFATGVRYNAGGIDLNRSFPDGAVDAIGTLFTGPAMDIAGRPAETVAMMQWSAAHSFALSATFHTGALVANYPFDNDGLGSVYSPTTDEDVFVWLAETYSSRNAPMWASTEFTHGITNGAAWYTVEGGVQDWLYRYLGCMDLTLEISSTDRPTASALTTLWDNNREAMLAYAEAVHTGVRGTVTAADKGAPLRASVAVQGRTAPVYTDADLGDYYRLLRPGTYALTVSAPGYESKTLANVTVAAGVATVLDVSLEASASGGSTPLIVVYHADDDAAFTAYSARKQAEGYVVTPIRLTGTPTADSVRTQIRSAYGTTAARYVVILGDIEKVPTFTNTAYGTTARSDLAYALLDAGETFDNFLGKDVNIGRISLDSSAEISEYVAKLTAFNSGTRHRDLTWVSGGSNTSENNIAEGTHNYVMANYIDSSRYHHELFYRSNGSAAELSAHINAGTDAVFYSGHGSQTGWYRYDYDGTDLAGLTNALDAPVVIGHCCLTGSFQLDDCFAEQWLASTARAVLYVGGSESTLWDEDDLLERLEFQYFYEHSGCTVAEALDWGLRQTAAAYPTTAEYYFTIYHLFGDPTVRLFGLPLTIEHTPLADSTSRNGPYVVEASVVSDAALQSVVLYWRLGGAGAFAALPMALASGTSYVAQIPGQAYGSQVQYYIQATAATGATVSHPENAPNSWHPFRVDVLFSHTPHGNTTDTAGPYAIKAGVAADSGVTVDLNWRTGGGAYTTVPMTASAGLYAASIPGQAAGTILQYYLAATTATKYVAYEPAGAPATVHRFVVDTQAPVFAGLGAAVAGDHSVVLSWLAATDASTPVTYAIYRATRTGGQDFGAPLGTTQGLVYTDTGVTNGTCYFYVIRAADALGNGESNPVELSATPMGPEPLYTWSLDTDPGWSRDNGWAYGIPYGVGGSAHGNPDPTAGATGTAVLGYNLSGDYTNNLPVRFLTTGPIDCSASTSTSLRFQRWLNVEEATYDHATIDISANGSDWLRLWENPTEMTDSAWTAQVFDVSATADGCATFYVRWGMGPTDSSWTYSGWNLDDIAIWGVPLATAGYRLTVTAVPPLGGTVDVSPAAGSGGRYSEGTVITLTAVPADGFAFTTWSGDVGGAVSPVQVVMSADRAVSAHFLSSDVTAPGFAGLASATPGDGQVELGWNSATDTSLPITYEVFRAQAPGGQAFGTPLASTQALSYTDAAVANGTPYYYVVRAVDAAGNHDLNTAELAATPRGPERIYAWPLDVDPGWSLGKSWRFGAPKGKGGREGGSPDPLHGYTGAYVLGYNLKGDYANKLKPSYLTSPAIDCSLLSNTQLHYRRWLNVERLPGDRAAIEVTTDGASWHTVWENAGTVIMDADWQAATVDLSAYADGCATVRLRWVMGPTNRLLRMSGWNLDDIEIWGVRGAARAAAATAITASQAKDGAAAGWRWPIGIGAGNPAALVFGMAPTASALEVATPAAPGAWLIGEDGEACSEVIAATAAAADWYLDAIPAPDVPLRLTWAEPADLAAGQGVTLVEVDSVGEVLPDGLAADLRRDSGLTVPAGAPRRLRIRCAPEAVWEFALGAGWNALASPLDPALPAAQRVFGDAASATGQGATVLRYDAPSGTYLPAAVIRACEGYWVHVDAPTRVLVTGAQPAEAALRLSAGWSLVGVPAVLADLPGAGLGVGPWYPCSVDGTGLPLAGPLLPGTAYWVFSPVPCVLPLGPER